jgi:hypothetical protein
MNYGWQPEGIHMAGERRRGKEQGAFCREERQKDLRTEKKKVARRKKQMD